MQALDAGTGPILLTFGQNDSFGCFWFLLFMLYWFLFLQPTWANCLGNQRYFLQPLVINTITFSQLFSPLGLFCRIRLVLEPMGSAVVFSSIWTKSRRMFCPNAPLLVTASSVSFFPSGQNLWGFSCLFATSLVIILSCILLPNCTLITCSWHHDLICFVEKKMLRLDKIMWSKSRVLLFCPRFAQ